MVFSMHCCKKIKQILFVCLLALFSISGLAANSSLNIKSAELAAHEDSYLLNADVDIKFSNSIEEAINKGFELNFLIEFQLATPRKYWFDDEVVTTTHNVSLSYHALSRQYLVIRGNQQKTFVRLDEAIDDMSTISELRVFQKSVLEKGELYKAILLMRLDAKKLPKTLQGEAMGSDDWKMSSQRFEWQPDIIK
ncbi:MAG: DUF4390 domain-containing protein [Methylotenera sp.]|nr:DUF4390 domain-containing protein [Methylotenera sp.]